VSVNASIVWCSGKCGQAQHAGWCCSRLPIGDSSPCFRRNRRRSISKLDVMQASPCVLRRNTWCFGEPANPRMSSPPRYRERAIWEKTSFPAYFIPFLHLPSTTPASYKSRASRQAPSTLLLHLPWTWYSSAQLTCYLLRHNRHDFPPPNPRSHCFVVLILRFRLLGQLRAQQSCRLFTLSSRPSVDRQQLCAM
jgi:hypothetical protein